MLGEGREFIYTIYNAKKHYSLDFFSINKIMNDTLQKVKVKNMRICDKKYFEKLKNTENEKIKIYEAVVWTKKSIDKDSCEKIKSEELLRNIFFKKFFNSSSTLDKDNLTPFLENWVWPISLSNFI